MKKTTKTAEKATTKKTTTANPAAKKTGREIKVVKGNKVSVTPQGDKFLVTETNPDGGKWESSIEDKNPLEDTAPSVEE